VCAHATLMELSGIVLALFSCDSESAVFYTLLFEVDHDGFRKSQQRMHSSGLICRGTFHVISVHFQTSTYIMSSLNLNFIDVPFEI
jgi:hypothetical protein